MPTEELVTVDTHAALVFELGKRDVPAWWMRKRAGVTGLEAWVDDHVVRVELTEPPPVPGSDYELTGYDAE